MECEKKLKFKYLPVSIKIHIVLLFIIFVNSMYPWYLWNNNIGVIPKVLAGLVCFYNIYRFKLASRPAPIFVHMGK